jgi:hypothetical protein
MGRSMRRVGAGCAGVLAGLAVAATPALANSSAPGTMAPRGTTRALPAGPSLPATAQPNILVASQFFGGYDVAPPEGISSDGSTFKMPTFKCPDTGVFQADVLGEAINNANGDFYQPNGDTDALSGALLFCAYGTPSYSIDALTAGGGEFTSATDINPGDRIQTRVEELASGNALATTTDQTTGQTVASEGQSLGDAAQIYEGLIPDAENEAIQSNYSIVKFKSVLFTRSQVGSLPLLQVNPTATALVQNGPVMVAPSAIAAKTPGRFTLTEKSTQ